MESLIAVFNNRNQAMQFASYLKRLGIRSKTINTPRDLSVSCGISVVFGSKNLNQVKNLIKTYGYISSVKIYFITNNSFKKYQQIF